MATMFDIEDADIVGRGDNGAIIRVRHKFDGEYVAPMTCQYRRGKVELRRGRFRVVRVDVDAVVVRTRGK